MGSCMNTQEREREEMVTGKRLKRVVRGLCETETQAWTRWDE